MKNLLVFFGWSVMYVSQTRVRALSNFIKKLCENEEVKPIFYFRNKKFYKYVEDILADIPGHRYYINNLTNENTWSEIRQRASEIVEKHNIDAILLSSMPILGQFRLGDEESFLKEINKIYEDDDYSRKFMIMFNFFMAYMPFIFMLKDNPNIKLYQYMDDPWEMRLDKIVSNDYKCIYEYSLLDRKVDIELPLIGYSFYYLDYLNNKDKIKKKYDFTTGFMIPYENLDNLAHKIKTKRISLNKLEKRVQYGLAIEEIENNFKLNDVNYNFFYKVKSKVLINKVVKDIEYNDYIRDSYFSFIFPSPKENEFPITRFYYSIARDCIPFFDYSMNFDNNFFKENPEILHFYNNHNLIEDFRQIPFMLNYYMDKYDIILKGLYELKFFKKLREENYFNEKLRLNI